MKNILFLYLLISCKGCYDLKAYSIWIHILRISYENQMTAGFQNLTSFYSGL
jgi:hypothetical protein